MFVGLTSVGLLCLSCAASYTSAYAHARWCLMMWKSLRVAFQTVTTFKFGKAWLDIYLRDGDDAGAGGIPNSPG